MKTIKQAINWAKKATWQDWLRLIDKLLPHVAIIISGMLVVFFVIDRVNKPMGFMTNEFHKRITFVLSLLAIYMAVARITGQRRMERAQWRRQAQRAKQSGKAQPSPAAPGRTQAGRVAASATQRTGSAGRTGAPRTSASRAGAARTGTAPARSAASRTATSTTRTNPRP